jgi:F0F1-type ATP synthase membrane subunit b/b'
MEEAKGKVMHEANETLEIFEEYKRRFTEAIEKEKERVRKQAEQESVGIIAEAEQKARQITEETMREAEQESARILTKSRELAEQTISEAERFAKAVTKVKQKVEQEIEKATEKVRQEADIVTQAIHKAEKTINETRNKLESELEESVKVITEVQQKLEQVTEATEHETSKEFEHRDGSLESAPAITHGKGEAVESAVTEAHDSSSQEVGDDKLFVGTLELDIIPPGDSVPLTRLQKCLSQIPGLELLLTNGSAGERTKVTVFVAKPLPLLETLKKMAPVKNAVKDKGSIQVFLETSDGWIN